MFKDAFGPSDGLLNNYKTNSPSFISSFLFDFFMRKNSKSQIVRYHEIYKRVLTERSRIDFDTRERAFQSSDTR